MAGTPDLKELLADEELVRDETHLPRESDILSIMKEDEDVVVVADQTGEKVDGVLEVDEESEEIAEEEGTAIAA